jgi:hypothetical protein
LGWYQREGAYGTYHHHNGGLVNGLSPAQGLNTGIVHFSYGYDAVLLINSSRDDLIDVMVEALES